MITETLKKVARRVADARGIDYGQARAEVSSAVTDLGIKRISYNRGLRSWEISKGDARALVEVLTEA